MARYWVCECGERWEEDGTGRSMGLAGGHLAAARRAGTPHTMRGLVDTDTGELLLRGLNIQGARSAGYVKGKQAAEGEDAPPAKGGGGNGGGGGRPSARPVIRDVTEEQAVRALKTEPPRELVRPQQVNNVRGVLETWTIVVPAPAFALFAMGREVIHRADGTPYPMTPDGFQEYLWDAFRTWHEDHMPFLLGLPESLPASDVELIVGKVMQRINETTYLHLAKWNGGTVPGMPGDPNGGWTGQ